MLYFNYFNYSLCKYLNENGDQASVHAGLFVVAQYNKNKD